jgi:hypothetical protein
VSALRYAAAAALGAALEASSPTLAGAVEVLQRPPTEAADYPRLAILPERFKFDPHPDLELEDEDGEPVMVNDGADAVVHVGSLEGSVRLWVGARYPVQREEIEDAVLAAFCGDDRAPGRLLVTLSGLVIGGFPIAETYDVAFHFEDTEWREELVFSQRRWSFTEVSVDVPVLVLRKDAHVVTDLVLAITSDLDTPIASDADLANLPELEQFEVAEDGSLTPYP